MPVDWHSARSLTAGRSTSVTPATSRATGWIGCSSTTRASSSTAASVSLPLTTRTQTPSRRLRSILNVRGCLPLGSSKRGATRWLVEDTQLAKAAHPVLGVPRAHDLAVLDLVDIDDLDAHLSVLRGEAHECLLLRAGH